jgi:hypothetical protein
MSTDRIEDAVGETPTTNGEAPTTELVSGAVGGRCANCQAPLASDQRYCLNCGQRRGKPRFPVTAVAASEPAAAAAAPRPPHRPRMSGAATLVAGVATLLIALGVGVLIGHDSNSSTPQRASQIITVGGGGGTSAGPANTTASSTNPAQSTRASAAGKASVKKAPKTVIVHLTPKIQQKAAAQATKVFGQSGNLSKNVTQQQGGSCSGGAGCQGGHFTGNFFPGG